MEARIRIAKTEDEHTVNVPIYNAPLRLVTFFSVHVSVPILVIHLHASLVFVYQSGIGSDFVN